MAKSPIIKVFLGSGTKAIDISDRITSFKYKRSIDHDETLEIDFEDADADWLMEQPQCYPGSPVKFSYGYIGGGMTLPITMSIGDIEPNYNGKTGTSLTIYNVSTTQTMKKLRGNKVFKGFTPKEIMIFLSQTCGVPIEVVTALFDPNSQKANLDYSTNPSADSVKVAAQSNLFDDGGGDIQINEDQFKNPLPNSIIVSVDSVYEEPIPSWPQGWETNYGTLVHMVELYGFDNIIYVEGGVIKVKPRNTASKPVRRITRGVSDVLSFKISYKEITRKGAQTKIGEFVFDAKTVENHVTIGDWHLVGSDGHISFIETNGRRVPLSVKQETEILQKALDAIIVKPDMTKAQTDSFNTAINVNDPDFKVYRNVDITVDDIERFLLGQAENASSRQDLKEQIAFARYGIQEAKEEMLTASLVELGIVGASINTLVTIAGFASMYNGNWFVWGVSDEITKSGGFITTTELRKGEGKDGALPTANANKTPANGTDVPPVYIGAYGWMDKSGINTNNPNVKVSNTPQQGTTTSKKAKITTR